jgi:hypothetical protein
MDNVWSSIAFANLASMRSLCKSVRSLDGFDLSWEAFVNDFLKVEFDFVAVSRPPLWDGIHQITRVQGAARLPL